MSLFPDLPLIKKLVKKNLLNRNKVLENLGIVGTCLFTLHFLHITNLKLQIDRENFLSKTKLTMENSNYIRIYEIQVLHGL